MAVYHGDVAVDFCHVDGGRVVDVSERCGICRSVVLVSKLEVVERKDAAIQGEFVSVTTSSSTILQLEFNFDVENEGIRKLLTVVVPAQSIQLSRGCLS